MSGRPENLSDWAEYISVLSGQKLFSQVVATNTQSFARDLVKEGMTMGDVEQIMLLFVRQLRATGTKVPGGGSWNLIEMAIIDPVARTGPTMSEEEASLMASQHDPAGMDDIEQFFLEAAFED